MAVALLMVLHSSLLRFLSDRVGRHIEGLAHSSRGVNWLSPLKRRKLRNLDATCAYLRHIAKQHSTMFFAEIEMAVGLASKNQEDVQMRLGHEAFEAAQKAEVVRRRCGCRGRSPS